MDFQTIVDGISKAACVLSIEKLDDGNYGSIRIVTGNRPYIDSIEKPMERVHMLRDKFVADTLYTDYMEKDINLEAACYRAAIQQEIVHSYAHPTRFDAWFDLTFLPLDPDSSDLCYCLYVMDISLMPDAHKLSSLSGDLASFVLETCIKLQNPDDFHAAMNEVCADIRELCGSEHCCILLMDTANRSCSVLCEAFSKNTDLLPMERYVDDAFYDIAYSWLDTLGGSNCLIVKNEQDMELIKERNPVWHNSITSAGGKTIVLFPLMFKNELLGYIWAINFTEEKAAAIKEVLELTTFILASELYSYRMIEHLKRLSYTDTLTKLPNRFASSDYVNDLIRRGKRFTVVSIDLNHFKSINDAFGFKAGNEVLKEVSRRWKAVADSKASEASEYITRLNGDEFLLIIHGYSSEETVRSTVQRYADALTDSMVIDNCDLYMTASFGYAEYPTDASTADSILSHADLAMNEIKNARSSDQILRFTADILKNERTLEIERVSTKMAKTQSLSLNPTKISGSCGRLMCCLRYEQEAYEELVKNVPKNGAFVETPMGYGNVAQINLLRQKVKVRLDGEENNLRTFDADEVAAIPGGRPKPGEPLPHVLKLVPKKQAELKEEPEDVWVMPPIFAEDTANLEAENTASEEKKTGGSSGRRRRGKKPSGQAAQSAEEKKSGQQPKAKQPQEPQPKSTADAGSAEKKPGGSSNHRRHRRGGKSSAGQQAPNPGKAPTDGPAKQAQSGGKKQGQAKPKNAQPAKTDGAPKTDEGAKKTGHRNHRNYHRKPKAKPSGGEANKQ